MLLFSKNMVANHYKKVTTTKLYMVKINGVWKRRFRRFPKVYRKYCPACGVSKYNVRIWM